MEKLGRLFSLTFLKFLKGTKLEVDEELHLEIDDNVRRPVFPPFPEDSIPLENWSIRLSNESGISDWIYGDGDFW